MAFDGTLMFGTGIDNGGFEKDVKQLSTAASVAVGNITSNIVSQLSSAMAQIPQQMISVGSEFEASMSQVAATMGINSATEEFETLSAAAKEMGETTKFSASQAGEALNYLALAGYDANKAVAALPTVLNVAAAGGMELAAASDMVTDAMSALGLETSQMADFSDKLAVTAQKSNTSVSQLGEAILTVGGTAKTLSGGVTEMNTALGILADNGIKGSEGGTMLRNVILSLSAPTSTAAAALKSLGVTAFDASGTMRPLQDTFSNLNSALSKLTQQERTEVLNEIFNKVDLKGVNALLGTSAERFDELSGYIDSCSGAAAQMAETMDDNLKGDLTILQSALEGLGIAAYEKFQVPMRTAVQEVTVSVGELTASLTDGELSDSFDKISDGFSQIAESALTLVSDKIIPAIVSGLSTIVDHADTLKTILTLVAAEFIALKAAAVLTPIVTRITAANTALNLLAAETSAATFQQTALASGMNFTEIAVGLFTGKITAATAAEAAFNAVCSINPIVLLTTALAALGVAFWNIASNANDATEEINEYQAAIDNARSSASQITSESEQEIAVIQRKAERYEELRLKYKNLTDGEMAEFLKLAEDIQEILPENTKIIDEQTGSYLNLADGIGQVTEKMRLQAALSAKYEEYSVAAANYYDIEEKIKHLEESVTPEQRTKADPEGLFSELSDNEYMNSLAEKIYGLSYDELKSVQNQNKEIIDEYEELQKKTYDEISSYNFGSIRSSDQSYAERYMQEAENQKKAMAEAASILAEQQEENTAALKAAWEKAEHEYAMGVISSEKDLYAQKSEILAQYGNADLEGHWKYYEELYGCEQDFAEESAELAKKAAEAREQQMSDEWNSIERMQSLGVLSAEDAYKKQLAFIEKYCAEYSDEWYSYYQTVIEYQRQAQQEQVDAVKENISELVSEYRSAYGDLESDINSYKNRLMSVGDLFSVDSENGSTIVSVENMRKQMAEMQKYHGYVSQLKAKGASRELISELTSMDFDNGLFTAENLANMSDAEFQEINALYAQKQELADKLANELYKPEMEELNSGLVNGVINEFGTLPAEIQAIGAEALHSFINGLSAGDISENVNNFTEQFAADCANGINKAFENSELNFTALMEIDNYSIGKSAGEEYVKGFNEAMEKLRSAAASEQYSVSAEYSAKTQSPGTPQNMAGTASGQTVIKNHIDLSVNMDGDKIAEKVIEKQDLIDYRKGK